MLLIMPMLLLATVINECSTPMLEEEKFYMKHP